MAVSRSAANTNPSAYPPARPLVGPTGDRHDRRRHCGRDRQTFAVRLYPSESGRQMMHKPRRRNQSATGGRPSKRRTTGTQLTVTCAQVVRMTPTNSRSDQAAANASRAAWNAGLSGLPRLRWTDRERDDVPVVSRRDRRQHDVGPVEVEPAQPGRHAGKAGAAEDEQVLVQRLDPPGQAWRPPPAVRGRPSTSAVDRTGPPRHRRATAHRSSAASRSASRPNSRSQLEASSNSRSWWHRTTYGSVPSSGSLRSTAYGSKALAEPLSNRVNRHRSGPYPTAAIDRRMASYACRSLAMVATCSRRPPV